MSTTNRVVYRLHCDKVHEFRQVTRNTENVSRRTKDVPTLSIRPVGRGWMRTRIRNPNLNLAGTLIVQETFFLSDSLPYRTWYTRKRKFLHRWGLRAERLYRLPPNPFGHLRQWDGGIMGARKPGNTNIPYQSSTIHFPNMSNGFESSLRPRCIDSKRKFQQNFLLAIWTFK